MDKKPTKSCDPAKKCEMCDQVGLPILPLRYAISRADVKDIWQGPALTGGFGKDVADIPLPPNEARYTLRLARQGYLYVFNEVRGEWKGYQITNDSYLLEFDPHAAPPPLEEFQPTCARMADSQVARFVTIPDPKRAGKVWFGFTEAPWPKEVLERNRRSGERKKHMRCVDVQAWLKGKALDHAGNVADGPALVSEFKFGRRIPGQQEVTIPLLPPVTPVPPVRAQAGGVDEIITTTLESIEVYPDPGFSFSFVPFVRCRQDIPGMEAWLQKSAAAGSRPMMLALNDPAGLVQELSALIRQKTREFEDEDDRGWKEETATAIQAIRKAIEDQAAAEKLSSVRASAYTGKAAMELYAAGITKMQDKLTPQQDQKARSDAWDRYRDDYSQVALDKFSADLPVQMSNYLDAHITPLASAFVGRYCDDNFRLWMACNHENKVSASSLRLVEIVDRCIEGVVGHEIVQAALLRDLTGRFEDIKNVTLKALTMNDEIAAGIIAKNSQSIAGTMDNPGAWSTVLKAYSHMLDRAKKNPQELEAGFGLVAKLVYRLSGVVVLVLTRAGGAVRRGGASIALSIAARNNMIALLGVVSGKRIERVGLRASEREFAHFLVEALSEGHAGINKQELRARIDQHLRQELNERSGARSQTGERNSRGRKVFEWAVFWDREAMEAVRSDRPGALANMLLSEDQVRGLVRNRATQYSGPNLSGDARLAVVGMVLDAWNVARTFTDLGDKKAGSEEVRYSSFVLGLVGFAGTSLELTGILLEKTGWGRIALASNIKFGTIEAANRAAAVGALGKALGTIGAFLGAVLDGWKAYEAYQKGDKPVFYLYSATAVGGAVVAYMILAGTLTAGAGFVVMLVLAGLAMLGEWLINKIRDDDIEKWLDKGPFGVHEHGAFVSVEEQRLAYEKIFAVGGG